jgi:hypothetical protein
MGGAAGQAVDLDRYIAVYNEKAGEFLIVFDRALAMRP